MHAVVDQDGLPVRLLITPGQASDKAAVPDLIAGLPAASALVADRGYDSRAMVDIVTRLGGEAHISTQSRVRIQRSVEPALYRRRNPAERFFCKTQALHAHHNALRQTRQKLPRSRHARVNAPLAQSL